MNYSAVKGTVLIRNDHRLSMRSFASPPQVKVSFHGHNVEDLNVVPK